MKVCVCGGTNPATNKRFLHSVENIAKLFCENNIELVWGGNKHGVLAVIHNEYVQQKKPNTLILPKCYEDDLKEFELDPAVTTVKISKTISERTDKMFEMADAIVFVPGGIGTIYEFWAAVEGKRAGEYSADLFLYNYEGFFDHQIAFFDFINQNGFTKIGAGGAPYKIEPTDLFSVAATPNELINKILKK
jgi:uncharacterized protein (TIGR00730 family)